MNQDADLNLLTTVRSGPAVDIIFMQSTEFSQYQTRNRFRYSSEVSQLDTTGGRTSYTASSGEYKLVVDNTDYVDAAPPSNLQNDLATVDVKLVAQKA